MISLPVQLFIAWRVKYLSKSIILPAIICLLAIASFGKWDPTRHPPWLNRLYTAGGIATAILVIQIRFQYSLFGQNDWAVITWLLFSAAADVMITGALVYSLVGTPLHGLSAL